jgi:clan AA aspartic protease (TIGR02281 family)
MKRSLIRAFTIAALPALGACGIEPTSEKCWVPIGNGLTYVGGVARMAVAQNGKPCTIRFRIAGEPYSSVAIREAPRHGVVRVWNQGDGSFARYTPAPDYVGPDEFKIDLGPSFYSTVNVDVRAIGAAVNSAGQRPIPLSSASNPPLQPNPSPPSASAFNTPPPQQTSQSRHTSTVPLRKEHGVFVVPVTINDAITLNFILDSGATDVSIPLDVFKTLVRAGVIALADKGEPRRYIQADGSSKTQPTFHIRSLRIGNIKLENVIGSLAEIDAPLLLGQTFLNRFKSWSIDNAREVLMVQ